MLGDGAPGAIWRFKRLGSLSEITLITPSPSECDVRSIVLCPE